MKRFPTVTFAFLLLSAGAVLAADEPIQHEAPDQVLESVELEQIPATIANASRECSVTAPAEDGEKVFTTEHGSHCTTPYTCTIQEPGLGFGCTCTYQCTCAYCNGELTPINCQLIDDGGCLACPI